MAGLSGIIGFICFDGADASHRHALSTMASAFACGDRTTEWRFCFPDVFAGLGSQPGQITPPHPAERQTYLQKVTLVADARLDDREELAASLDVSLSIAAALPDSALILRAYCRWGRECVHHLLGDFAFAIWDGRTQALFCARDHRGSRPLFYHQSGTRLTFASAPRALAALPHVPKRLNQRLLAEFLVLAGDAQATFYEDISRVPPAGTLSATAAGVQVDTYWAPDPERRIHLPSDHAYIEQFRDIFESAVRCRLRGTHPIGAFMSGGLDSSSVASLAARQLAQTGQKLTTFTSVPLTGFPLRETATRYDDETPFIEAITSQYDNMVPVFVRAEGLSSLDGLDDLFPYLEAPVRNPTNRIWMEAIVGHARARGIHILLNGQEGNEWISYHGLPLLYELASSGRWVALLRELRAVARTRGCSALGLLKRTVLKQFIPHPLWIRHANWRQGPERWARYSAINPRFAERMRIGERLAQAPESHLRRPLREGRVYRAAMANSGAVHFGYDLYNAWRALYGVELRDPTADKRLIEFCLAIPHSQHLHQGEERALVRRAMERVLPPAVRLKRKRGTQAPDWLQRMTPARGAFLKEIDCLKRSPTARECLDLPRMQSLVENWPAANTRTKQVTTDYLLLLDRGINVGRFIRWFEGEPACS